MLTSKNTSIHTLPAIAKRVDKLRGWLSGTRNLDIGAGKYDELTEYLREKGVKNYPYDPHNRTEGENALALFSRPYNTVTISNVLNVIQGDKARRLVLELAAKMLDVVGAVFITVYEGDKSGVGKVSKTDCWQENRRLKSYVREVQEVFDEVVVSGGVIACWRKT